MSKKTLVYKTREVAEMTGKSVAAITNEIRKGNMKATKVGKEYLIPQIELDRFLGIETTPQAMDRELYIKDLENKIRVYEFKIKSLKNAIESVENVLRY
ncbi:DNA binding domain-containing protein, excisionase family [Clostridium cadaveris]|uniref:DNA binding domain-containing protein, excisionase family n=1 Tax=Clostridium cadaveris TaxID=1529 RepID=A0A1I2KPE3_9CLOT|nr:helix-turn-helix domain-containing protein [Clostridium cadaveris]UFH65057.1 helix-turn-helix domain-containing protein [Clostridium cadaveris]SFF68199.1 DNA binding domain-containing protein, excisionase family [Clostridium cadaveris]